MPKLKDTIKPLYPLHHEHSAALENVLQKANNLALTLQGPVLDAMREHINPKAFAMIEQALADYYYAKYGPR